MVLTNGKKSLKNKTYNQKKFLGKRDIMATKGAHQRTFSKRLSGAPPGLLSFVPLSEQKDFYQYLEIQYLYWKKERDRLAYKIRRSITHLKKLNSFNTVPKPVSLSRASLNPTTTSNFSTNLWPIYAPPFVPSTSQIRKKSR